MECAAVLCTGDGFSSGRTSARFRITATGFLMCSGRMRRGPHPSPLPMGEGGMRPHPSPLPAYREREHEEYREREHEEYREREEEEYREREQDGGATCAGH